MPVWYYVARETRLISLSNIAKSVISDKNKVRERKKHIHWKKNYTSV